MEYKNLGKDELRSVYDSSALTILINLDHPVVAAALGDGNVEDPGFMRLSYEVAFSEYAMALGYETAREDPDIPADDLLYEVRASLNRVRVTCSRSTVQVAGCGAPVLRTRVMRQPRVFVGRAFVIPPREVAHGEWRPPPGSSRPDGRSELHRQPDREPAGADRPDANPRWGLDCPPMLAPDNRTDDRAQDRPGGHRDDKQPA